MNYLEYCARQKALDLYERAKKILQDMDIIQVNQIRHIMSSKL